MLRFVICWCLLLSSTLIAQRRIELSPDTLALIGGTPITAKDFLERFELMPWQGKDRKDRLELTKQEFLFSLAAEKLLALEATAQNLGGDEETKNLQYSYERMFVRDELYKKHVTPKSIITTGEISDGMKKYQYQLDVELLGIFSKQEGDLLLRLIQQSKAKLKTLQRFKDSLYIVIDTLKITFGTSDDLIEQTAYTLELNQISSPLFISPYGWVMIRLLKKYQNNEYSSLSTGDQITKVRNIILRRKEDSIATKYFGRITSPQRAEARTDLFLVLADSARALMKRDSIGHRVKNLFNLPASDIDILINIFREYRDTLFVMLDPSGLTMKEVLLGLKYNYIVFPSLEKETVYQILNNNIKTVIQNEILSRQAYKENLQYSENVRHDLSTWMNVKKASLLYKNVFDTLKFTKEDIQNEMAAHPLRYGARVEVNLREILVESLSTIRMIEKKLKAGEEMSLLAKKYSIRKAWGTKGGESGFIDVDKYGELGWFAMDAQVDTLIGPLKIKEGYTLFKVLARRIHFDTLQKDQDSLRSAVLTHLLPKKKGEVMDTYIGTLAKKYGVTLYTDRLVNVKTTATSMFTWRNIGFGGRIVAVPSVVPQYGWIEEWKKQIHLNQ